MNTSIDTTANLEATYFQPTSEAQDSNFQADINEILQSIIDSLSQQIQQSGLLGGTSGAQGAQNTGDASGSGSGLNAQSASGALASYMNENGLSSLNPDQLYQIAYSPKAGTPPTVLAAAKYMLVHSSTLNAIETHDVPGADGIAGVGDFNWAAEGGLSRASQSGQTQGAGQKAGGSTMTAQSASGALAAYMKQNNTNLLDVNGLYQIAYNPSAGTSAQVSAAAKYMLQHPDTFNKIETNDWTATDGIANTNQFDWAADGQLNLGTTGSTSASPLNAQSASGALASYMNENGISSLNPDKLYQMAYSPDADTPPTVSAAAKYMLVHSSTFNAIETHDVPGADGIAGVNDFQWAAEGGLSSVSPSHQAHGTSQTGGSAMTAQSASAALAAYMRQDNTNLLDVNGLYQIAYDPSADTSSTVSAAAKYMLQHPDTFNQIETKDWTATDGIANTIQFDWAAEGELDTANKSA